MIVTHLMLGPDAAPGAGSSLIWADLPLDIQRYILSFIPLAELAGLAPWARTLVAAYEERLEERQACIEASLAQGWPEGMMEGLSAADTAVPRDLIVSPPVSAAFWCFHTTCFTWVPGLETTSSTLSLALLLSLSLSLLLSLSFSLSLLLLVLLSSSVHKLSTTFKLTVRLRRNVKVIDC
jgi:hypothetical protein